MIQIRNNVQSTAVCETDFVWTSNNQGLSPCFLLVAVSAPCIQGNSTIGPLPPGYQYEPPIKDRGTANRCTCSWAAYNLMGACTVCQGHNLSTS
ncbi:hypothetical protein L218DRAFT_875458 [Marasmius fiardii PR-910]|nr:hypothetical protein L218DRAFT_875458 [Marasmius fiardii PR-910]